jgi:hypothetical protein
MVRIGALNVARRFRLGLSLGVIALALGSLISTAASSPGDFEKFFPNNASEKEARVKAVVDAMAAKAAALQADSDAAKKARGDALADIVKRWNLRLITGKICPTCNPHVRGSTRVTWWQGGIYPIHVSKKILCPPPPPPTTGPPGLPDVMFHEDNHGVNSWFDLEVCARYFKDCDYCEKGKPGPATKIYKQKRINCLLYRLCQDVSETLADLSEKFWEPESGTSSTDSTTNKKEVCDDIAAADAALAELEEALAGYESDSGTGDGLPARPVPGPDGQKTPPDTEPGFDPARVRALRDKAKAALDEAKKAKEALYGP